MKCDKETFCHNRPEWRVIFTNNFLRKDQRSHKLNYCDQCYNKVNPQHKRILVQSMSDLDLDEVAREFKAGTGEDIEVDPDMQKDDAIYMILKFRRLHH